MLQDLFEFLKTLEMKPETYRRILRFVSIFTALGLWWMSIQFSIDGFSFSVEIENGKLYGLIMALAVTVLQLVWNRTGGANMTLMFVGLLAYGYGIFTNIVGISVSQNINAEAIQIGEYTVTWFAVILGFLLEITPETLLVWGLTDETNMGDFIGNMVNNGIRSRNKKPTQQSKPTPTPTPQNHSDRHR